MNHSSTSTDWHVSRCITLAALGHLTKTYEGKRTLKCLEANAPHGNNASGTWKKHFEDLEIYTNYQNQEPLDDSADPHVTNVHPNVALTQGRFDFIFLECRHNFVPYLESVFKSILRKGMIVLSSYQDLALYTKDWQTILKYYGGFITKTYYYKELAARLILAALVREAAKCNRSIEPLLIVNQKNYLSIVVHVSDTAEKVSSNLKLLKKLIHCELCEDRCFYPDTNHPVESPYSLLHCDCKAESNGPTAVDLGPIWSGRIFNCDFVACLLKISDAFDLDCHLKELLTLIAMEATCATPDEQREPVQKKRKVDGTTPNCIPFYFSLHKHSPKSKPLRKTAEVVKLLDSQGFSASRTHFDTRAVRTNANATELYEILNSCTE